MSYNIDGKRPAPNKLPDEEDLRPTVIRPMQRPERLFPGWGPRL